MEAEKVPFSVEDLYDLDWLEDPQLSPDGRFVAYVHVRVDRLRNSYRRSIWIAPTDGSTPKRFTSGSKSDTSPRWSPDGSRLAFVSNRDDEKGQIYIIDLAGGEAQQLTAVLNGASAPAWSADGTRIAFLSRVNEAEQAAEDSDEQPEPPSSEWEAKRKSEQRAYEEAQKRDPLVVTKLPYRSGTSFFDDRRSHIYIVDVPSGNIEKPAQAKRITSGDLHYSAPEWEAHGNSLLTTATRDPEADSLFGYYDVVRVYPDGRAPEVLTSAGYSYFNVRPSPDGKYIAFTRKPDEKLLGSGAIIAVIPSEGGQPRDLTELTDLSVNDFEWRSDSSSLLFTAEWYGRCGIYEVALEGVSASHQDIEICNEDSIIASFSVASNGGIAYVAGSAANPCELYYRDPDGKARQLTSINAKILSERIVVPFEELRYTSADGAEVQGWILRPPGFDSSENYPLVVHIHGGPHTMWGPGTRSMWHEWQTTAARGYVVFFCNPRGSEGYGELWRDGIRRAWGENDAPDILAGIDRVIEMGGIDPQRIAVTGGSYGGYMTTWLISHSDRFCAAVSARGVYNLLTEHSTSDAHELIEIEFDGYPWELQEELWEHSPLAHAHRIETPLLILHSEQDYRVPISEAEQLFAILRRRKRVVELVRYPREGHELTRSGEPRHRVDHLRRTLDWFDRYCKETRSDA